MSCSWKCSFAAIAVIQTSLSNAYYRPLAVDGGRRKRALNARGKPRRSAKHGGYPQAKLVGVGLTNRLGW